jgi:AI-2 transport protein TqsA
MLAGVPNEHVAHSNRILNPLLAMAAVVVIVAGLKAASPILVPFLVAAFISLLCAPALFWLRARGVPNALALLIVLSGLLGIGAFFGGLVSSSINEFTRLLPSYQARFGSVVEDLIQRMAASGIDFGASPEEANPFDPQTAAGIAGNLVGSLGSFVNSAFLIFLTVFFILLEASSIPRKVQEAFGASPELDGQVAEVASAVRRYLVIKTIASSFTGLFIYLGLMALGVKFAPLWGLVAFLLNFVPAVGSILAAVPTIALALVDGGPELAIAVTILYLAVNMTIGNFIEPQVLGQGVGLSPLVVVTSLVFWGFVLGPVGMVLAVPLTVILRIALDSQPQTQWLAVLLGPAVPKVKRGAAASERVVGENA